MRKQMYEFPEDNRLSSGNSRSSEPSCHPGLCNGDESSGDETTRSSRLGEPAPGLMTMSGVAPFTRAVENSAGVAEVWPARWTVAAPATCGVAIEVPEVVSEMVSVAVSPAYQPAVAEGPGAKMSRIEPALG